MSTVTGKSRFTPEDVLRLEGEERFELVDGQLVSIEMSALAAIVTSRINAYVTHYVSPRELGVVLNSEASFQCYTDDPDRIRRPDTSFIERSRMQPEYLEGHIPIPPDLAIEVVSPNDRFYDVQDKVVEYLQAGVRLVWVLNPKTREIHVYPSGGLSTVLKIGDALDGGVVIPGFRCPLAEIFAPLPMGAQR
jgi:Uma2 family endonuclease